LWEIVALCSHYHPSVVSFATRLRDAMQAVQYEGDPLKDFTLGAFLDKFCYRKPKQHVVDSLHGRRSARLVSRPLVNSQEFRQLGEAGQIEEDERFFLRFFQTNPGRTRRGPGAAEAAADLPEAADAREEGADKDSDSEEEAFEQAMRAEMKRLGGGAGGVPGDVDEVDADELKAFHATFGQDVAGSSSDDGDSGVDNADGMRLIVDSEDGEAGDGGGARGKKLGKSKPALPLFAPAEDYAEALAREDLEHADDDNSGSDSDGTAGGSGDEDRALATLMSGSGGGGGGGSGASRGGGGGGQGRKRQILKGKGGRERATKRRRR
jgi:ribosome biogenesis protein MAK21